MTKKILLTPLALASLYAVLTSYSGGPSTGSINGTGAVAGTPGCGGCHGSTPTTSTTVTITLDSSGTPVTHYVAGQTYNITITGTQTSSSLTLPKFGFQLTAISATGAGTASATNAGTLATTGLPSGCANVTVGSIRLIEHTTRLSPTSGSGGAGTVYSRSVTWTAPATGSGTVKLMGVLNAVNLTGADAADKWNLANVTLTEENAPVTGAHSLCAGDSLDLSCATAGGTWSTSSATIASVNASTGRVYAVGGGTASISYTTAVAISVVSVPVTPIPNAGTITGPLSVCAGATISLSDSGGTTGGTWSSGAPTIASVNVSAGVVRGMAAGTATMTYTVSNSCGSATATRTITVLPLPVVAAIAGSTTVCEGATTTLSDSTSGGSWSSGDVTIASIDGGGVVFGLRGGSVAISYAVTNSCGTTVSSASASVTALPTPGTIGGAAFSCLGASPTTLTISGASGTGSWTSTNTSVAIISSSGTVTNVGLGTTTIAYDVRNSCGTRSATRSFSVNANPFVGTITATTTNVCVGAAITLVDTITGGTWSTSNSVATVSPTGIVTGLRIGTDTIRYTISNSCGTAIASQTVSVFPVPNAGVITVPSILCVWTTIPVTATGTGGALFLTNGRASLSGINISGISPGLDTLVYTTTNSCGTATTQKPIMVNPLPYAGHITGTDNACPRATASVSNSTSGGVWSSGNPSIATINSGGTVFAVTPGVASINYSTSNVCGSALTSLAFTVRNCFVEVEDMSKVTAYGLTISPNPNSGSFTLNLGTDVPTTATAVVINTLGKQVAAFTIETNKPHEQTLQLPAGIYFVMVTTNEQTFTARLVVE